MKLALLSLSVFVLFVQCNNSISENPPEALLVGQWKNTVGPSTIEFDQENNFILRFSKEAGWSLKYSLETSEKQKRLILYDSAATYECDYSFLEGGKLRLDLRQINTSFETGLPVSTTTLQRVR